MKNTTAFRRITGPLGTQPGGVFETPKGQRYYVKQSKSDDHARNEVLASLLYTMAGVDVVQVELVEHNGRLGTSSPMIDGAKQDLYKRLQSRDSDYKAKIRRSFAVDAWLANWDVAGLVFDNIVSDANDNPVRVDTGGCLLYRGMGEPKGAWFGNKADEWETMRDFVDAPQAAHLFAGITREDLLVSALKVVMVTSEQIRGAVRSVGFGEPVASLLIARRVDIANRAQMEV